jgi:hypothetical protein
MGTHGFALIAEISLRAWDTVCWLHIVVQYWYSCLFRYTMLPALSSEGLIYAKVKAGPFNGDSFLQYIEEVLEHMNPYPAPQSVLIMDNCSIHRVDGVAELCNAR